MQFPGLARPITRAAFACAMMSGFAGSVHANIVIGSFDGTHSQRPFTGAAYSNIRTDLTNDFPGTTGQSITFAPAITTATTADLSADNVFVLSEVSIIDPLSSSEIAALKQFVLSGHELILISDTAAFGQSGSNAMLQAFGEGSISGQGAAGGDTIGSIIGSGKSTNGPFGTVDAGASFAAFESATINPGPDVTVIGQSNDAAQFNLLAEIPSGKLGSGSGAVLIASKAMFQNPYVPPATLGNEGNVDNRILFENFIAAVPEPASLSVVAFGAAGLLGRVRRV